MCCVNFTQVASETWPSYIFLSSLHHQMSLFLFLCYKIFLSAQRLSVWSLHVLGLHCVGFSMFSARESKLARGASANGCVSFSLALRQTGDLSRVRPRLGPMTAAMGSSSPRWSPWAGESGCTRQKETKISCWYYLCQCRVFLLQLCWSRTRSVLPLCFNGGKHKGL